MNISKSSRPESELLDDKTKAYCNAITTKLRNLKPKVKNNFRYRNNLTTRMQKSQTKIKKLVRSKQLDLCKATKTVKF